MEKEEIIVKDNIKEELLRILTDNKNQLVMIFLSKKRFEELVHREDVRTEDDSNYELSEKKTILYIYVNGLKKHFECIGMANFERICGWYVLKEFRGQMHHFPKWFGEEASKMILII